MAGELSELTFFLGEWDGEATGRAGDGVGFRSYRRVVGDRYVEVRNTSTYQPQELNPEGEVHEELGIFSHDGARETIVLREFHTEGFVISYTLVGDSSGELVFQSEDVENGPDGLRARLTMRPDGEDQFEEIFELSLEGQPFQVYIRNRCTRRRQPS